MPIPFARVLFWIIELVLVLGIFGYCFYITGLFLSMLFEVPYVPSNLKAVREAFAFIRARPNMKLIELGCGDGRVLCTVAKEYGLQGKGIDLNPVLITIAKVRALAMGVSKRVQFFRTNARDANLKEADILYVFMLPKFLNSEQISQKIKEDLRPGTHVISHWYEIDHLKSKQVHKLTIDNHNTYIYTI